MKTKSFFLTGLLLASVLLSLLQPAAVTAAPLTDDPQPFAPIIRADVKHDLSIPLTQMTPLPATDGSGQPQERLERPNAEALLQSAQVTDSAAIQDWNGPQAMPAPILNFNGVNNRNGVHPPDTNGDVGPNHYVQWVNLSLQIWDKNGSSLYGPVNGNTIWQGFGTQCETTNNGDPIVLYDEMADRWFISQFSLDPDYYVCIAVSQTPDPTGAWYRYAFLYSTSIMNDYPKFGVWPDGYYMSVNQFYGDNGVGVVAYERERMLQGLSARQVYFNLGNVSYYWALLPSDMDGTPPPDGAPNYFINWEDASSFGPNDALRVWNFDVNWANPAASTFGINGQPNLVIPTTSLNPNLCGGSRNCVPQLGATVKLDAIAGQTMYRAQYRNFGSHQSIVSNMTVDAGSTHAGVYWFELRDTGSGFAMYQQGVYAPDATHRWMGSAALDSEGNLAIGYSASSSSIYPEIRYAGRSVSDPLNQLPQGEVTLHASGGAQTSTYYRWGDYSNISVDPADGCTFWFTTEYVASTGYANWATRIGSFRFPNCTGISGGSLEGTVTDAQTGDPIEGAQVKAGFSTLLTGPDGSYSLNLAAGSYTVEVSAYGYFDDSQTVEVVADETANADFALDPRPTSLVTGYVRDGAGHDGMPIYARLDVFGAKAPPIFTDPLTGSYGIALIEGYDYTFTVTPLVPGYPVTSQNLTAPTGGGTQNFDLLPSDTCEAPGYGYTNPTLYERFESGDLPTGWTIKNYTTYPDLWRFDDPGNRGNLTGGSGSFAILDSNFIGAGKTQNIALISPLLDLSSLSSVLLAFDTDFNYNSGETADVDISTNGGSSWVNVWRKTSDYRGPQHVELNLSTQLGGKSNVKIRFHYYNASNDLWWQVDNVLIGADLSCEAQPGGLAVGHTWDANTLEMLSGVTVSSNQQFTTSFDTPADDAQEDGLFIVFAAPGTQTLHASAPGYSDPASTVTILSDAAVAKDLPLAAGLLSLSPASVSRILPERGIAFITLTLENQGGQSASYQLQEMNSPAPAPMPIGPFAGATRHVGPKRMSEMSAEYILPHDFPPATEIPDAGQVLNSFETGLIGLWGLGLTPDGLWLGSLLPAGGNGLNLRYVNGMPTEDQMDTSFAPDWAADMAYNPRTGKLWQMGVGGENCIYELDLQTRSYTGHSLCPGFGISQRGLAYDPISDSFYASSWNDAILYHFDSRGQMLDSHNIQLDISGLAFNPDSGLLYALQNVPNGAYDIYVLDPANDYAVVGAFDVPGLLEYGQGALDMGCDGSLWLSDRLSSTVYQVSSGESHACTYAEVGWMTASPSSGSIPAGDSITLTLTLSAKGLSVGSYEAHLLLTGNTPYPDSTLPVTLEVQPGHPLFLPALQR